MTAFKIRNDISETEQLNRLLATAFPNSVLTLAHYNQTAVENVPNTQYNTNARVKIDIKPEHSGKGPSTHYIHYNKVNLDRLQVSSPQLTNDTFASDPGDYGAVAVLVIKYLEATGFPLEAFELDTREKIATKIRDNSIIDMSGSQVAAVRLRAKTTSKICTGTLVIRVNPDN